MTVSWGHAEPVEFVSTHAMVCEHGNGRFHSDRGLARDRTADPGHLEHLRILYPDRLSRMVGEKGREG